MYYPFGDLKDNPYPMIQQSYLQMGQFQPQMNMMFLNNNLFSQNIVPQNCNPLLSMMQLSFDPMQFQKNMKQVSQDQIQFKYNSFIQIFEYFINQYLYLFKYQQQLPGIQNFKTDLYHFQSTVLEITQQVQEKLEVICKHNTKIKVNSDNKKKIEDLMMNNEHEQSFYLDLIKELHQFFYKMQDIVQISLCSISEKQKTLFNEPIQEIKKFQEIMIEILKQKLFFFLRIASKSSCVIKRRSITQLKKEFQCKLCRKRYETKVSLLHHVKLKHSEYFDLKEDEHTEISLTKNENSLNQNENFQTQKENFKIQEENYQTKNEHPQTQDQHPQEILLITATQSEVISTQEDDLTNNIVKSYN